LGYRELKKLNTYFKPDTVMRWFKRFVAEKYEAIKSKIGRPPIPDCVRKLVIRLAEENETWGGQRIADILSLLGFELSKRSVLRILKAVGIEPAPERTRKESWGKFLKRQWAVLAAVDFTTIEIATLFGLKRVHLLFAMELHSRKVQFVGLVPEPNDAWMANKARGLVDYEDGFLKDKKYVLADGAKVFHGRFKMILKSEGVNVNKLPPRSPNLNAYMERFFRSLKSECIGRVIFFSERSLEKAVREYVDWYHHHRPHQGLDGKLIVPSVLPLGSGEVRCKERLGGMLKSYYRDAA
jgi:hypothetical protein